MDFTAFRPRTSGRGFIPRKVYTLRILSYHFNSMINKTYTYSIDENVPVYIEDPNLTHKTDFVIEHYVYSVSFCSLLS